MQTKQSSSAFLSVVVLIFLIAYVGSYVVLVLPEGRTVWATTSGMKANIVLLHYRTDGQWQSTLFWPLEQLDRTLRPASWANNGGMGFDFSPPVQQMMPMQLDQMLETGEAN